MSTGPLQSSIKSVSKLASSAKTTAGGLKSNNGIEKSKSAIQGTERSEEILATIYIHGIEHAQEFAQRELDDEKRSWQKLIDKSKYAGIEMIKKAVDGQALAGIGAAALTGIGGGIAAMAAKNNGDDREEGIHNHRNSNNVQKLAQNDSKNKDKIQEINQEGHIQSHQQQNLIAHSEQDSWQNQDFGAKHATDPEHFFS